MILQGEVGKLEGIGGDEVQVSIVNTKAKISARWRDYGPTLVFNATQTSSKAYPIGRKVKITVEPK